MMTLREFVEKVNFREHYRIYQPNRDCLIYESYYTTHSPYYFDKEHEHSLEINKKYWEDNNYCDSVRQGKELDEETKILLDRYGDYEVFSLECCGFKPHRMYTDTSGQLHIENIKEYPDYISCFNLFIKPSQVN